MGYKIINNILQVIGNTPIMHLHRVTNNCEARILAKLEMFNPSGSVKARSAFGLIQAAEESGLLNKNSVIVEPTSGNQGIGLAMVAAVKGYRVIIVMPENMSIERRQLLKAYGAELILTPAKNDLGGAIKKAREIAADTPNAWMPDQFSNPANPKIHYQTTAREIIEQVDSPIDAYVAGVGTGGTLTGIASLLREKFPNIQIYAVEPANSAVITGQEPGAHQLQGIGDGFIPDNLDLSIVDRALPVTDEAALVMTRRLAREEGILAGISSGAAVHASVEIGKILGPGKTVVTILPDTGERYLTTSLFDETGG